MGLTPESLDMREASTGCPRSTTVPPGMAHRLLYCLSGDSKNMTFTKKTFGRAISFFALVSTITSGAFAMDVRQIQQVFDDSNVESALRGVRVTSVDFSTNRCPGCFTVLVHGLKEDSKTHESKLTFHRIETKHAFRSLNDVTVSQVTDLSSELKSDESE